MMRTTVLGLLGVVCGAQHGANADVAAQVPAHLSLAGSEADFVAAWNKLHLSVPRTNAAARPGSKARGPDEAVEETCVAPNMEITLVVDVSMGWSAYREVVSKEMNSLVDRLRAINPQVRVGVTSFTDKPAPAAGVGPQGGMNKMFGEDFCHLKLLPMTTLGDDLNFGAAVENVLMHSVGSGRDAKENQLGAMVRSVVDPMMGHDPTSPANLVVLFTDTDSHHKDDWGLTGIVDAFNSPLVCSTTDPTVLAGGFGAQQLASPLWPNDLTFRTYYEEPYCWGSYTSYYNPGFACEYEDYSHLLWRKLCDTETPLTKYEQALLIELTNVLQWTSYPPVQPFSVDAIIETPEESCRYNEYPSVSQVDQVLAEHNTSIILALNSVVVESTQYTDWWRNILGQMPNTPSTLLVFEDSLEELGNNVLQAVIDLMPEPCSATTPEPTTTTPESTTTPPESTTTTPESTTTTPESTTTTPESTTTTPESTTTTPESTTTTPESTTTTPESTTTTPESTTTTPESTTTVETTLPSGLNPTQHSFTGTTISADIPTVDEVTTLPSGLNPTQHSFTGITISADMPTVDEVTTLPSGLNPTQHSFTGTTISADIPTVDEVTTLPSGLNPTQHSFTGTTITPDIPTVDEVTTLPSGLDPTQDSFTAITPDMPTVDEVTTQLTTPPVVITTPIGGGGGAGDTNTEPEEGNGEIGVIVGAAAGAVLLAGGAFAATFYKRRSGPSMESAVDAEVAEAIVEREAVAEYNQDMFA